MNTLKFGNGEWYGKKDTILAYNDLNSNFKPLAFNFERNTSATRVNKDGLIETVGSGEPRIDYKDDSKGALKLEPSRSNIAVYSEYFNAWITGNVLLTSNADISPEGLDNAYKVTFNNLNHFLLYADISVSSNTQYTFSFYVKRGTATNLNYRLRDAVNSVDIIAPTSYYSQTLASGWKRIEVTFTTPSNCDSLTIYPFSDGQSLGTAYLWGVQLEQGSYATSYIPTQGSAVTRDAESCNQTVPSGVIGQTEGTLYAELGNIPNNAIDDVFIELSDGTSNNRILFYADANGHIRNQIKSNGSISSLINTNVDVSSNMKIAITYKTNEAKVFINGVQYGGTDTSVVVPSVSKINLENYTGTRSQSSSLKETKLYDTALTDQELINLTTI